MKEPEFEMGSPKPVLNEACAASQVAPARPLAPQVVGLIEDRRDPPLFIRSWNKEPKIVCVISIEARDGRGFVQLRQM